MNDLLDLYQEIILDHNQNPRNFGELENADYSNMGDNPMCGDKIKIQVKVDDNIISDIKFSGQGCAISQSSASLLTTIAKNKKVVEVKEIIREFLNLLTNKPYNKELLGNVEVLAGVKKFPSRIKCASLAWHALYKILQENY